VSLFVKVDNCLLKLLYWSGDEIGGSGLSGGFLTSSTENNGRA